MHMHARSDHRNAHARRQLRGRAVVVGIDADSARYRVKTRVCVCEREHIAAWTVVCNGVYVCVVQQVTHVAVQGSSRDDSCGSALVYGTAWSWLYDGIHGANVWGNRGGCNQGRTACSPAVFAVQMP